MDRFERKNMQNAPHTLCWFAHSRMAFCLRAPLCLARLVCLRAHALSRYCRTAHARALHYAPLSITAAHRARASRSIMVRW